VLKSGVVLMKSGEKNGKSEKKLQILASFVRYF